jgi:hypothetical protein
MIADDNEYMQMFLFWGPIPSVPNVLDEFRAHPKYDRPPLQWRLGSPPARRAAQRPSAFQPAFGTWKTGRRQPNIMSGRDITLQHTETIKAATDCCTTPCSPLTGNGLVAETWLPSSGRKNKTERSQRKGRGTVKAVG